MMFDAVPTVRQNIAVEQAQAWGRPGRRVRRSLPDVPTVAAEAGVPGYEATIWLGVLNPANARWVAAKLNAEIRRIVSRERSRPNGRSRGGHPW